ncbi:COG4223 family protein [Methylosinus sp. Sm6]|uniref:COG4223 family protein n=1 Tax=Methylosinus sp. Sm6 TaxID=2866948 RepID=UPI001C99A3DB|nr:hypothetical protein [Methylosinus sp. Sm6]MBY6241792.1 hypothetical protein [Methylosinus sp. Sm6]
MAQDPKDPETRGSGAADATDAGRPAVDSPAEAPLVEPANSAPLEASVAPPRRKNRLLLTSAVAVLGLAATAGSIAAYRFRDKHEKLAAFAALVDDYSARPEKLVASLRETSVKWLGDAARPTKKPPAPEPRRVEPDRVEPKQQVEAKIESRREAEAKPDAKPAEPETNNGERITWSAPPTSAPPPPPPPRPAALTPPPVAPAPEQPPKAVAAAAPEIDASARAAEVEALTKRVEELAAIARSALDLAEQARASADASAPKAKTSDQSPPTQAFRDLGDNVSGLEGRIDELGDEVKALRDRLDAPKDETRLPREAVAEPPPRPAEAADEPNPAALVVIAHSLQKALERGAPFSTELAALDAQGADKDALDKLAPVADAGAPTPRALKEAFHPLVKSMEAAAEPKPATEESISERLLHHAAKLVKMKGPGEAEKIEIADVAAKIEQALDHAELGSALTAFADLPEEARAVARDWEQTARRRLEAESAAAAILSSAIAQLGKPKSKS